MDYPDISDVIEGAMVKAVAIHGHKCPSLVFGVTISLVAMKIAEQLNISPLTFEIEGKTDCFKDGVYSVIGDNNIKEMPLRGRTLINVSNGNTIICIEILESVKRHVNELKEKGGKETFLENGLNYLSSLAPQELYTLSILDNKPEG